MQPFFGRGQRGERGGGRRRTAGTAPSSGAGHRRRRHRKVARLAVRVDDGMLARRA